MVGVWNTASIDVVSTSSPVEELAARFDDVGAPVSVIGGRARNGKLQSENGWRLATPADETSMERHLERLWAVVAATCPGGIAEGVDGVVLTLTTWSTTADDRSRTVLDPDWVTWLAASNGWVETERLGVGPPPPFRSRPDGSIG